jgi:hypothetical protein
MKKILLTGGFMLSYALLLAQMPKDTLWKAGGNLAITFAQTSLTNWAAGGENSLAENSFLNLFANYKKGKSQWDNNLELAYGIVKIGTADPKKSEDRIDLSSKYGYKAFDSWFYSALFNFKSQFTPTYNYPENAGREMVSKFFSPAYLFFALGLDYKPHENFSVFISPLTLKTTLVLDDSLAEKGAYGVAGGHYDNMGIWIKGENVRQEIGGYFKLFFRKALVENVDLQNKLELFSSYSEHPENIDINWEVLIAMKINKYLSANINTQLLYDDDIIITDKDGHAGPRTQFKEVFGVGFSYKF